ncbi:hypothetical protein ACFPDQ_04160 [Pseudofrancisella aestuarii]|uniref:Uncharacterized protein n=1 Tax=Pseudofrancisella aestuarii TaxID=2670347 RepID=A0ABV9TAS4_9GAMM|nr:hypothetical protein [Pseudofrancisella aestuarii]
MTVSNRFKFLKNQEYLTIAEVAEILTVLKIQNEPTYNESIILLKDAHDRGFNIEVIGKVINKYIVQWVGDNNDYNRDYRLQSETNQIYDLEELHVADTQYYKIKEFFIKYYDGCGEPYFYGFFYKKSNLDEAIKNDFYVKVINLSSQFPILIDILLGPKSDYIRIKTKDFFSILESKYNCNEELLNSEQSTEEIIGKIVEPIDCLNFIKQVINLCEPKYNESENTRKTEKSDVKGNIISLSKIDINTWVKNIIKINNTIDEKLRDESKKIQSGKKTTPIYTNFTKYVLEKYYKEGDKLVLINLSKFIVAYKQDKSSRLTTIDSVQRSIQNGDGLEISKKYDLKLDKNFFNKDKSNVLSKIILNKF